MAEAVTGWDLPTELEEMVNIIACDTVGHRKGQWCEYVYTNLQPIGKHFRWRTCSRCGATTDGERPQATNVLSEVTMAVYSPAMVAQSVMRSANFLRALRGT